MRARRDRGFGFRSRCCRKRPKQSFLSENRSGYLNLNTWQRYDYGPTKHRLTQIQRTERGRGN